MPLSDQQRPIAQRLLKQFVDSGKSLTNQGITYPSFRDLDKARAEALPKLPTLNLTVSDDYLIV